MGKNYRIVFVYLLLFAILYCMNSCKPRGNVDSYNVRGKIKIGFSMGTIQEDRWQRDRDIFVARAKELGADVIVQNANEDNEEQFNQVKYLVDQGIDVLVIVPHDANKAQAAVQYAKRAGKKVIAYDRLVLNADLDLYISFDNVRVGELMAEYLVRDFPRGNYIIVNGSETDYNSYMFNEGYYNVLQDYIDNGKIKIIDEVWANNWMHEYAFLCVERNLLEGKHIDAVIAANDNLATAAIEALAERRLAGKVGVVGHDADIIGCQRVVEGTQLMTVYKPINQTAKAAAEAAVSLVKGEKVEVNNQIYNGKNMVPYYMVQPIPITKHNINEMIIKGGFHRVEDVYRNVPKEQWPNYSND
ncbi:MAG: sugar ABC transporter substrate-binding protein [Clostridiaceae bacterium]|nr:sugar ABC transporter substrate-binding protein [Clostridiaceae bacterium]